MKIKTFVYIDGFNLYYRLKNTSYKWLNLQELIFSLLDLKQHDVLKIKYFTALVKPFKQNDTSMTRQNLYLRALKTTQNLEIIYGQFKKRQVRGNLCDFKDGKYKEKTTREDCDCQQMGRERI